MRKIIRTSYYEYEWAVGGRLVKIPINVTKTSGCYAEILDADIRELVSMLSNYSKVLTVRFVLRIDEHTDNNPKVSKFLKPLRRWSERRYDSLFGYIWAREHNEAEKQHYHITLMLNGDTANEQSAYDIIARAEHIAQIQGLSIGRCKNQSIMVRRGDLKTFLSTINRDSYIAKENTKLKFKGISANSFSASRIKQNFDKLCLVMPQLNLAEMY